MLMPNADYVIVGAGSAGCVLAARLSEDASCEVALLEAGGEDRSHSVRQPSRWPLLWDSAENWGYSTTLQAGYNLRSIPCPRGKVLGGSSSINIMIYIRSDVRLGMLARASTTLINPCQWSAGGSRADHRLRFDATQLASWPRIGTRTGGTCLV